LKHTLLILFSVLFLFSCKDAVDKDVPEGTVLGFVFQGFPALAGNIDPDSKTITLTLPYQTNLKGLVPQIQFSEGFEIIPGSGIEQDFSKTVYYTLVSPQGKKVIYKVEIKTEDQPAPEIHRIKADSVEAGYGFQIAGRFFGTFPLDAQVSVDNAGTTYALALAAHSDSLLTVKTTEKLPVGDYTVKVRIKNLEVAAAAKLKITKPAPRIRSVGSVNFFPADTLRLLTEHIEAPKYTYGLRFVNGSDSITVKQITISKDTLKYAVAKNFSAGKYTLKIVNLTDGKVSREKGQTLEVFAGDMPYVRMPQKHTYTQGENVSFKTENFEVKAYRFYQLTLSGNGKSYVQNGIYNSGTKTLLVGIPEGITGGTYSLTFTLSDPAKQLKYDFKIDDQLVIK
jgi:hypothetical protein